MITENRNHRKEIDGLRAIAVLAVVIYHLNGHWLNGGFTGVDIFFVISGYLITSIVIHDLKNSTFSYHEFYQRRIARLFPAYFVVAISTAILATIAYSELDLASAGANLAAATMFLANVKYMLQGNYFETSPDSQPYLHYWSLSIEEQFYLLFPLLLVSTYKLGKRPMKATLIITLASSFALCIALTNIKINWAFYLLPTRSWELLIGALLAINATSQPAQKIDFRVASRLSLLGFTAIIFSFFSIKEHDQFPGWLAAIPAAGAALLIYAQRFAAQGELTRGILTLPPLTYIGRRSYSLYLWHWPIYSFIDYTSYFSSDAFRLCVKIILCISLADLSYRLIEKPSRIYLSNPNRRRSTFFFFLLFVIIGTSAGLIIRKENYINSNPSDIANGGIKYSQARPIGSIILMGDSNASMYGTVLRDIGEQLNLDVTYISVAAGDTLPYRDGKSNALWLDSLRVIKETRPNYLIIANHWLSKLSEDPARLQAALDSLMPFVGKIILINQPPILPPSANREGIRKGSRPPFYEPTDLSNKRVALNSYLQSFASSRIDVLDIATLFQGKDGSIVLFDEYGKFLYQDSTHLSGVGARRAKDMLIRALTS